MPKTSSRQRLTDAVIHKVRSPSGGAVTLRDESGVTMEVRPTTRAWVYRYTSRAKVNRKLVLGYFPDMDVAAARAAYAGARAEVASGGDPVGTAKKTKAEGITVKELTERFMAEHVAVHAAKSVVQYERLVGVIASYIGQTPVKDVTPQMVDDMLRDDLARIQAKNRKGTGVIHLRRRAATLFEFAAKRRIITTNPVEHVPAPATERPKERYLSEDEIRIVWRHMTGGDCRITTPYRLILSLILATGQRPGEVCAMRRSELDMAAKVWTIPAKRNKSARTHLVPLSDLALHLIRQADGDDYLFPAESIRAPHVHEDGLPQAVSRICTSLKDKLAETFTPHDLRRSCATHLGRLKVQPHVVSAVLNHARQGVTARVYDRYTYLDEKRTALDTWSAELCRIVGLDLSGMGDGKVVSLRAK